jgi:hypothetical protein
MYNNRVAGAQDHENINKISSGASTTSSADEATQMEIDQSTHLSNNNNNHSNTSKTSVFERLYKS